MTDDWKHPEFLFSPTRNADAAKHFFAKAIAAPHTSTPCVITVDKGELVWPEDLLLILLYAMMETTVFLFGT